FSRVVGHSLFASSMPSPYDVYIKSARPLVISPPNSPFDRTLRLGQKLIKTHAALIEFLPVLSELAAQQESEDPLTLSPLIKYQPCLTEDGLDMVLDFVYGKAAFIPPEMISDVLAVASVLRIDELVDQVEQGLVRMASYDNSVLFSLEHAVLNMNSQSSAQLQIIGIACDRVNSLSKFKGFTKITWPTFEALMKEAATRSSPADFMEAFITWVDKNRHNQTRACSLLISSPIHLLSPAEHSLFMQRSASLYLHGVSFSMSKLSGSTPLMEKRTLTQRWSTSSDISVTSSVDLIASREEPYTPFSVDLSQLSEYSDDFVPVEMEDSIEDLSESMLDDSCFDDSIQEDGFRLGAGADTPESSSPSSHSLSTANSSRSFDRIETKMVDFGTIPIPDGGTKQIQLSIVLDDTEEAINYIRKMRFHFDMEVDPKN
ncbi:hypothetical protein PFISCL1PPCAC_2323, partial [Pristionchus fissidentatus]